MIPSKIMKMRQFEEFLLFERIIHPYLLKFFKKYCKKHNHFQSFQLKHHLLFMASCNHHNLCNLHEFISNQFHTLIVWLI